MTDYRTHPEYLALLETVRTHPHDDAPRLILSDWLEEHGQESRAAEVRGKSPGTRYRGKEYRLWRHSVWRDCCPFLSTVGKMWPVYVPNDERVVFTTKTVETYWGSAHSTDWVDVRLGFVEVLHTTLKRFQKHGAKWLALNPIRRVVFLDFQRPDDGLTMARTQWADPELPGGHFWSWPTREIPAMWLPHLVSPSPVTIVDTVWRGLSHTHQCYVTRMDAVKSLSNAAINFVRAGLGMPPLGPESPGK